MDKLIVISESYSVALSLAFELGLYSSMIKPITMVSDLDFCWVSLEDLKKGTKVYPLELIPYILEPGKEIVHFVSKQI